MRVSIVAHVKQQTRNIMFEYETYCLPFFNSVVIL